MCRLRRRLLAALLAIAGCTASSSQRSDIVGYSIVHVFPHDPQAFTQGLVYVDGHLYESTGLNGRSSLRMVDLNTGHVLQKYDLPPEYFAEGLTDWQNTLIQLTWRNHKAFVYDRFTFSLVKTFTYDGEGWGITHDRSHLIMSDGSSYLRVFDPKSFHEVKRLHVVDEQGHDVEEINELEYVRGEIYANIWHSDRIARISPESGKVLGWIDASGLRAAGDFANPDAVLNGIAYDAAANRLFVTGKLWAKLYEIKLQPR